MIVGPMKSTQMFVCFSIFIKKGCNAKEHYRRVHRRHRTEKYLHFPSIYIENVTAIVNPIETTQMKNCSRAGGQKRYSIQMKWIAYAIM